MLLNNKDIVAREIRPTLYNLDGNALEIAPVIVEANSHRLINLNEWANLGGANFRQGSLKLFHTGKDLNIGSQIYLADVKNSLSFEERLTELGKFDSRRLESIWLMPDNQTQVTVILSNTSDETLEVSAKLSRKPQHSGATQIFTLLPHQTRVLDLRKDFDDGNQFANAEIVGLSLEHAGEKSALKAHGQIRNTTKGYSNIISFSNPNTAKSSELHGTGLHLGTINKEELTPIIAIKNVGTTRTNVTTKIPYTRTDGTTGTVNLNPINLKVGEMRLLNLNQVVQRSRQEQIEIAGIEIVADTTNTGSILVNAQSVAENYNQVYRVPMADPFAQTSSTGGYPWRIEETSRTLSYIKNMTDLEQEYIAYLSWENGGKYSIGLKKIAPHKTVQLDVKKLRDEQIPDFRGNTIPLNQTIGQIKWTLHQTYQTENPKNDKFELIGRSEQIDESNQISSSYACQNCCLGGDMRAFITTDPQGSRSPNDDYEFEVGQFVQYYTFLVHQDCYNNEDACLMSGRDWESNNLNVATVNSNGLVEIVNAGIVEVNTKITGYRNLEGFPCPPDGPLLTERCENQSQNNIIEKSPSLAPGCGDCLTSRREYRPDSDITVTPKVRITPFEVVGKGSTFPIAVQVTGNNNNTQITLRLTKLSGTGESQFANNTSTTNITQSGTVELKGITESSAKDNYIIETLINNRVLPRTDSKDRFSIAKVKISRTVGTAQPTEVTDLTADTIVGERIKLNAEILPAGITISSHLWTLPGNVMKDFLVVPPTSTNPTASTSQVVAVDSLTTANVDYVWYDGADARIVNYKATVGGSQITGKTTFNVKRPEATTLTISTRYSFTDIGQINNLLQVHYGRDTAREAGIRFSQTFIDTVGSTQWVQTVNYNITATLPNGTVISDSDFGLDKCYPFRLTPTTSWDSPGFVLSQIIAVNLNYQFSSWYMFKPTGADSSWIPLRKINWRWLAQAQLVNGNWSLISNTDPNNPVQPVDINATDFPIWSKAIPTGSSPCR